MKKNNLLLVGLGSIGSRYFEAINKINFFKKIYIFDKKKKNFSKIKQKLDQKKIFFNINFLNNLKNVPSKIDFLIISTTSKDRLKILKKIIANCKIKFAILEKVLAQSLYQLDEFNKIAIKHKNYYVSTLKKKELIFYYLKKIIKNKEVKKIYLKGYNWNLCCNSIHFIDLFEYLLNKKILKANFNKEGNWYKSKRPGYLECNGKLEIFFKKKIESFLECSNKYKKNILYLELKNKEKIYLDLDKNICFVRNKKIKFKKQFLSTMMQSIIKNILKKKQSGLTSLFSSVRQHKIFLTAMLMEYKLKKNVNILPIT
jgi:hypothetical protein